MSLPRRPLSRLLEPQTCSCPCRLRQPALRSFTSSTRPTATHADSSTPNSPFPDLPLPRAHNIVPPVQARRGLPLDKFRNDLLSWSWNGSDRANSVVREDKSRWKEDVDAFLASETEWEVDVEGTVEKLHEQTVELMVVLAERGEVGALRRVVRTMMEGREEGGWAFDDGVLGNTRPFQTRLPEQVRLELAKVDLVYPVAKDGDEKKEGWVRNLGWILTAVGRLLLSEKKSNWVIAKQILAYLHSIDAVPRSLYDPESHPRLSVSEQRILTILTDAVWAAKDAPSTPETKEEKDSSWSLGSFWGSSTAPQESHGEREILLELLLSFCFDGGYLATGQILAREVLHSPNWKFAEMHMISTQEASQAQAMLESGLPTQMGVTGYEVTPPPIDIQKQALPRALERRISELSITAMDPVAVRELLATLKYKYSKQTLSVMDVQLIRYLVNTQVVREYLDIAEGLVELIDHVRPLFSSPMELRSEILLRQMVVARMIFNEMAVGKVKRHWNQLQRVVGENRVLLPEGEDYEYPRWLLGLLLDFYTRYDMDAAFSLLESEDPLIKKEAYIDLLPYMVDYILSAGSVQLAEDLELLLAEVLSSQKITPPLSWLQDLLSLWLRLGSRSRAKEVLAVIQLQKRSLNQKGEAALITGALQLAHRAGTTLDALELYLPSVSGQQTPLTNAYLASAPLSQPTWLSIFKTAFQLKDRALLALASSKLGLASRNNLRIKDAATAATIVEVLLTAEGIPAAWRFFNTHFRAFAMPAATPLRMQPTGERRRKLVNKPAEDRRFPPTRELARLFLRHSTQQAFLQTNEAKKAATGEEGHRLAVVKDVQSWAGKFLLKTGNWSKEDFSEFHRRVLAPLRPEADPEKKEKMESEILAALEAARRQERELAPVFQPDGPAQATEAKTAAEVLAGEKKAEPKKLDSSYLAKPWVIFQSQRVTSESDIPGPETTPADSGLLIRRVRTARTGFVPKSLRAKTLPVEWKSLKTSDMDIISGVEGFKEGLAKMSEGEGRAGKNVEGMVDPGGEDAARVAGA